MHVADMLLANGRTAAALTLQLLYTISMLGLAAYLVLLPLRMLGQGIVARLVGAEAYGQEALYGMYFNLGWSIVVPLTILALLVWTYRSARRARV